MTITLFLLLSDGCVQHVTSNGTAKTGRAKTFRKGKIMSYEIKLDGTMADIPLLVSLFKKHWHVLRLTRQVYHDMKLESFEGLRRQEIDQMLSGDYDYAVEHFNGWFGADVELISPELQREREAAEREAQDVIDKADFN
jgi:hypothetical protein